MVANREEWLQKAAISLKSLVFVPKGITPDLTLMAFSCSWPGGGDHKKRIGECWKRRCSPNGVNQIFISPLLSDRIAVLDTLAHEMIHAIDDLSSGHGGAFRSMATKIGLTGKMKATVAGPELMAVLRDIADELGPWPHEGMKLSEKEPKQTTRMLKASCAECGCTFRMTSKWFFEAGNDLTCPACQCPIDNEHFRV